jgi:hypothetical protein
VLTTSAPDCPTGSEVGPRVVETGGQGIENRSRIGLFHSWVSMQVREHLLDPSGIGGGVGSPG